MFANHLFDNLSPVGKDLCLCKHLLIFCKPKIENLINLSECNIIIGLLIQEINQKTVKQLK